MFLISLSDVTEWLFNIIGDLFNLVWALLCSTIYGLIAAIFNIFNTLSQLNVLSDFGIEDIYQRISMIIIIVMAFYITFEMVKYVVQPDMINDKSKGAGNMVKKIVLVILLLAFTPRLFSLAYDLQGRVLKGHVIEKVILGEKYVESDNDHLMKTAGSNFAANLFGMFFTLDEEKCPNGASTSTACAAAQSNIDGLLSFISSGFNITGIGNLLFLCESVMVLLSNMFNGHLINFSGLLALGVGIYVLWSLLAYSIELANRYFQLMYLQITAPIAIIGHLAPSKDSMLNKWFKQCITTYLDLFIRILILNFVIFLCSILHDKLLGNAGAVGGAMSELTSGTDWTAGSIFWVYLFLIIGLFRFVSKAPKLLKELFPSSGGAASSGFSLTEPFKSAIGTGMHAIHGASRAIGGVVGAYTGVNTARKSARNGALKDQTKRSKLWSGMKAGYHGAKTGFSKGGGIKKANEAAMGSVQRDENIVRSSGTVIGHDFYGNRYARENQLYDNQIADLDDVIKAKSAVDGKVKDTKIMKNVAKYSDEWSHRNIANANVIGDVGKKIEKATRVYAVSQRDDAARQTYNTSVNTEIGRIYDTEIQKVTNDFDSRIKVAQTQTERINLEQEKKIQVEKLNNERIEVINNLQQFVQIDPSTGKEKDFDKFDKLAIMIEDAQRVSRDVNYIDPKTGEVKDINYMINDKDNIQEFAEKIGDVEGEAGTGKDTIETSQARRTAKANANGSGGSGGGGHH